MADLGVVVGWRVFIRRSAPADKKPKTVQNALCYRQGHLQDRAVAATCLYAERFGGPAQLAGFCSAVRASGWLKPKTVQNALCYRQGHLQEPTCSRQIYSAVQRSWRVFVRRSASAGDLGFNPKLWIFCIF